ncbi:hypothetical protein GCM10014713_28740 [Streptomyces purpureus]|uniref:Uncharacterized protein n=1 Tax=Streptomyces purpureus TaxID=1951 RepID=A0A918H306_9ACTN|nr:hypothetical protein GCM10014713_28740 [Streptomyces purpureus]
MGQLAGRLDVVPALLPRAEGGHDRRQLGVALVELARVRLIGVDRRVGELLLEIGVFADQFLDRLEHRGLLVSYGKWGCGETANAGPGHPRSGRPKTGAVARYFLEPAALPKRASKRATRPPVSRIFCLPV